MVGWAWLARITPRERAISRLRRHSTIQGIREMKTKCGNLTEAQISLLTSLPDVGTNYVVEYYKPAVVLVERGLAFLNKPRKLALTGDGLLMKKTFRP